MTPPGHALNQKRAAAGPQTNKPVPKAHEPNVVPPNSVLAQQLTEDSSQPQALQPISGVPVTGRIQRQPQSQPGEPHCDLLRQEFMLRYVGWPGGRDRCITTDDQEFRDNYIDNNIVKATAQFAANTTWENVDINRVVAMLIEYRDGSTKEFNVNDIPASAPLVQLGPTTVRAQSDVDWYERRSDGLIYPIRWRFVALDPLATPNLVSLRSGLANSIKQLQLGFLLIEAGVHFVGDIAALGGFAAMNHAFARGGMFEPVPKKARDANHPGAAKRIDKTIKNSPGDGQEEHGTPPTPHPVETPDPPHPHPPKPPKPAPLPDPGPPPQRPEKDPYEGHPYRGYPDPWPEEKPRRRRAR
jgi:hypothetical protein